MSHHDWRSSHKHQIKRQADINLSFFQNYFTLFDSIHILALSLYSRIYVILRNTLRQTTKKAIEVRPENLRNTVLCRSYGQDCKCGTLTLMFCGGLHEFLVQLIKFLFVTLSLPSMSIMLKLGPNASCLSLSENDNRRENN